MSDFSYQAKNQEGHIVQGVVEAASQNLAVDILHNKNYVILSLEPIKQGGLDFDVGAIFSRPNYKDLATFTRQLSTLLDADMPLSEGLRTLAKQVDKASFKKIISDVAEAVEGGSLLSAALAQYPKFFSDFYIKLVQSGEVSGKLHDSLLYLADYVERSQELSSKMRGALTYPAFIVFSLVLVGTLMATFVLPNLLAIFKEVGDVELPITTRMLIWATDFFNDNIFIVGISTTFITAIFIYFLGTPEGRDWFDGIKVRTPPLGGVVRNLYLARIAESLTTLMKSGIPILDSLRITGELVGNSVYRKIMEDAEESVKSGGSISSVFSKYKEIPPLFSSMVAIGERTGKMDFILEHVSRFYKAEAENSITGIAQIIEPALILILGVAVAGLVSSILLPMYTVVGGGL